MHKSRGEGGVGAYYKKAWTKSIGIVPREVWHTKTCVCTCAVCMGIKNGGTLSRGLYGSGQGSIDVMYQSSRVVTPVVPVWPCTQCVICWCSVIKGCEDTMRLYGSPRRIFLTSHTGANTQQLSGKGLTDWQVWNFKIDLFNICACSYYEYLTMLIRLHTFTESSVGLPVIFLLRIRGGGGVLPDSNVDWG
jgi:hypothetical protein